MCSRLSVTYINQGGGNPEPVWGMPAEGLGGCDRGAAPWGAPSPTSRCRRLHVERPGQVGLRPVPRISAVDPVPAVAVDEPVVRQLPVGISARAWARASSARSCALARFSRAWEGGPPPRFTATIGLPQSLRAAVGTSAGSPSASTAET